MKNIQATPALIGAALPDRDKVVSAVKVLRAVNHDLRQQIMESLIESPNDRMSVTEIHIKLCIEQSAASQHLAILRRAGVVKTQREGKFIYYSINKDRIDLIGRVSSELAG